MLKNKSKLKYAIIALLIACLSWLAIYVNSLLPIATGYAAKNLCSAIFISNRQQKEVEAFDLNFSIIKYVTNDVDYSEKSVTSHLLWKTSKAIYRNGFGCTLLTEANEADLRNHHFPMHAILYNQDTINWPLGNRIPAKADQNTSLNTLAQQLINEHKFGGNIYAFVVLHKGVPIVEHYKKEFNASTRFLSWSMAKSFTNALAGIVQKEKGWDINKPTGLAEWQNDNRKNITPNNLMQMQSGLNWNEDYGNRSNVTLMLNSKPNFGQYAINQPLRQTPGTKWYYSSGTTNIVNYLMRLQFNSDSAYYAFTYSQLFNKIGIPDAVFEVDESGTLAGSSYIYATARDYARFGLLYLQNGKFNGQQILPEGWVAYSTTPASDSNNGYGAFFWLNKNHYYPSAPADMFSCNGHDGQRIFIIPSKEMVVVILGYSPKNKGGVNFDGLLKEILKEY